MESKPAGMNVGAQPAVLTMEVVVRDKDGNVKYEGPLTFVQLPQLPEESPNGSNS
jgi:hypothetical protein